MNVDCGWSFNSVCDTRSCLNYLFSISCQAFLYGSDNMMFVDVLKYSCNPSKVDSVTGTLNSMR